MSHFLIKVIVIGLTLNFATAFAGACHDGCRGSYERCVNRCYLNDFDCPGKCYHGYRVCLYKCPPDAPALGIGDEIRITQDAKLYSVDTVVGEVKAGERYIVTAIQNEWASLKKLSGEQVRGWIQISYLELINQN